MRGKDRQRGHLGGYVNPEARIPQDHPLRQIRPLVDAALTRLSPLFDELYSPIGRPSIPPEHLLRASLLQAFFTIRSERQLMEQLSYNLLFRWFVGLSVEAEVWDVTVFTKNRDRLLEGDVAHEFLRAVLADPQVRPLLSDEHFSVDGTLIEAWASMKSFRRKDGSDDPPGPGRNRPRDFRGEKLSNETHASTTDPDARLYKKARRRESRLGYLGHLLMEHRSGLIVQTRVTPADGHGERDAALVMVQALAGDHRVTVAGDKGYDTRDFVAGLRANARDAPHRAAHDEAPQCGRREDDASCGLCDPPAEAETRRARIWLDEDDRRAAQTPPPRWATRRVALQVHRHGLQHRADASVVGPGDDLIADRAS